MDKRRLHGQETTTIPPEADVVGPAGVMRPDGDPDALALRPGPRWDSFERFRVNGSRQLLERLGPGQVGELQVKGRDYVIMERGTFNQLYGLAQEVGRLSRGLLLVRQAVQLVMQTGGAQVAVDHLRDLAFHLPGLTAARPLAPRELLFDEDERATVAERDAGAESDFELDPIKVRRPDFAARR